jgi:ubiquinone/menaquinone biosynthesis C-methylase UbiE
MELISNRIIHEAWTSKWRRLVSPSYCSRFIFLTVRLRREIDEFAGLAATSGQWLRNANQRSVVTHFVSKLILAVAVATCFLGGIVFSQEESGTATDETQSVNPFAIEQQQDADSADSTNDDKEERDEPLIPEPVDVYMGRRVARTMGHQGADWLTRDTREREERCSLMLSNLGVKRGMTICDMGCGNGYYSLQLAELTGEKGLVVGVDVQPEMLSYLRDRMESKGIDNIIPILGSYHNPRLPENMIDMILLVDVYHEFSHPEEMLAAMRKSLKPDGVLVFLEYRLEDPDVPIKRLHKMSKKQVDKELTANGFKLVRSFDELPWQHMLFYGKDDGDQATETSDESDRK